MKRSEINAILKNADEFIRSMNFALPPFAYFTPEQWLSADDRFDEIRDNMLGWDVTDYGHDDFKKIGLTLFTIRNGSQNDGRYTKPYAEKLIISDEMQVCPCHFHFSKTEDIINRSGGNLIMQLWQGDADGNRLNSEFDLSIDGERKTLHGGDILSLKPGMSVTLTPYVYHAFWAEKGFGRVLIGEVSSVNDDNTDNRFFETQGRFPSIVEDEPPHWLLCNEYRKFGRNDG